MKTNHRPEQDANTATTYNYYNDDRIQQVVDARGATISYSYDNRGLTTQVSTTSPNASVIPITPTVTMTYDNIGNRTSMTDGLGTQTYEYNQLSQLTAETRQFNVSVPTAPLANNSFRLQYSYSLSGQLKSLTEPFGTTINYDYDKVGRLNSVTGTPFAGLTSYANNPHYRAWGAMQNLSYGNGVEMGMTFNNRLQVTAYNLQKSGQSSAMQKNYQYYEDGNLRYVQDTIDSRFDRLNILDHVGRPKEAKSGAEANGQNAAAPLSDSLPYRQSYQYDAFNNLTQRNNLHWGTDLWNGESNNLNYTYQNNRKTGDGHDADGRVVSTNSGADFMYSSYDATGLIRSFENQSQSSSISLVLNEYDGNGQAVKRIRKVETANDNFPVEKENNYYIRSSVFGNQIVTEINTTLNSLNANGTPATARNGTQRETNVIANNSILAKQSINLANTQNINFQHWEAAGMSSKSTDQTGTAIPATTSPRASSKNRPVELDAMGGSMGSSTPYVAPPPPPPNDSSAETRLTEDRPYYVNGEQVTCEIDGIGGMPLSMCLRSLSSGAATIDTTRTSKSTLIGLGITANYGYRNKDVNHPDDPNTITIYTDEERYIVNYSVSMDARAQTQIGSEFVKVSYQRESGQQTENPYPNCYTFYQLIYEHEYVKEIVNDLWEQTYKKAKEIEKAGSMRNSKGEYITGGGEHGGVLFFNQKDNLIQFNQYKGYKETVSGERGALPDDYLEQLKEFRKTATPAGFSKILLAFHTHPPDDFEEEAYNKRASDGDLADITRGIYGGSPLFGIVIYGKGKFKVYGRDSDDDETLKRTCIGQ